MSNACSAATAMSTTPRPAVMSRLMVRKAGLLVHAFSYPWGAYGVAGRGHGLGGIEHERPSDPAGHDRVDAADGEVDGGPGEDEPGVVADDGDGHGCRDLDEHEQPETIDPLAAPDDRAEDRDGGNDASYCRSDHPRHERAP